MPDCTEDLLPRLAAHRLPNLDLGPQAVHPFYGGLSILNLPSSLARWLGAPPLPHPALDLPGLDNLMAGARQIVLILADAVAFERFRRWVDGPASGLQPLIGKGLLAPLTSVVPSTTVSALTTLWTGRSPAEHAQVGYELFLKEYGLVANMLTHSPAVLEGQPGLLHRAGLDPETALPVPRLGSHLSQSGVEVHAFLPHPIRNSGLSRMHLAGSSLHGFATLTDLWVGVRDLAQRPIEQPRLIWAYYGEVDALSHRYGPDSEQAEAEFGAFAQSLMSIFEERLSPQARRHTALILLSDHGQITTRKDPRWETRNHASLTRLLHLQPTGENRFAYLYLRPGQDKAVEDYVHQAWPGDFQLLRSDTALHAGLFGPGAPAAATPDRIGDRIAVSQGDAYLWWGSKENALLGRHGGVSPEEMLVPFLAAPLG